MEIYIKAKSKKAINERLANNEVITGYNYSIFGGGGTYELNDSLQIGTVIKVYDKEVNGTPYTKAYGMWNGKKVI
jgi:hypothetical protein